MLAKVKNQLQDLFLIWGGLRHGEYPVFIRRSVAPVTIPVFSYHTVLADEFEAQLRYLRDNAYRTLDADAYFKYLQEDLASCKNAVVLTFDDGTRDFYEVAFPLLQKYQMQAVVFLIPDWMGAAGMLTWEQIREMHQSGLVDFQSHTFSHQRIFISSQVVDFLQPQSVGYFHWNLPVMRLGEADVWRKPIAPGTPVYQFASRMSEHLRYFPPEKVARACADFVQQNRGELFFKTKDWRKKMHEFYAEIFPRFEADARYESVTEQADAIRVQLLQGRLKIEQEIPGKKVRHLAFPYNESGRTSRGLLETTGYLSAYGGMAKLTPGNGHPVERTYINRVSGDFILALPGKNRRSMHAILASKIKRRLTKGAMY